MLLLTERMTDRDAPRDPVPLRPAGERGRREPLWRHLVGEQLRRRRQARGEGLRDVAHRAGVSMQYLSEVERGLKEPSSEIVAAVAAALDTTLLDLTGAVSERLSSLEPSSRERSSERRQGEFRLAA